MKLWTVWGTRSGNRQVRIPYDGLQPAGTFGGTAQTQLVYPGQILQTMWEFLPAVRTLGGKIGAPSFFGHRNLQLSAAEMFDVSVVLMHTAGIMSFPGWVQCISKCL